MGIRLTRKTSQSFLPILTPRIFSDDIAGDVDIPPLVLLTTCQTASAPSLSRSSIYPQGTPLQPFLPVYASIGLADPLRQSQKVLMTVAFTLFGTIGSGAVRIDGKPWSDASKSTLKHRREDVHKRDFKKQQEPRQQWISWSLA